MQPKKQLAGTRGRGGPALDSSSAALSPQKASSAHHYQKAKQPRSISLPGADKDCQSQCEGEMGWRTGCLAKWSKVLQWALGSLQGWAAQPEPLGKICCSLSCFIPKAEVTGIRFAVRFVWFYCHVFFFFFSPRVPDIFLHKRLKLFLMSSFEVEYSWEQNQDLLARASAKTAASPLEWGWEAAVRGLNGIEQCCSMFLAEQESLKKPWAQTCLLQELPWSCQ